METDDPTKPEFASWRSYENFKRELRRDLGHADCDAGRAFIATVLATCGSRDMTVREGQILCRAQLGYEEIESEDEERGYQIDIWAYGAA